MLHPIGIPMDPFAETSMVHIAEAHHTPIPRSHAPIKVHSVVTGILTGTAVPLVVNPIDKLVTNIVAAPKGSSPSYADALKNPYKGVTYAIASNIAKFAALLETKRVAQTYADKVYPESPIGASVLASAIAGAAETVVTAPFSYIKTQLYMGGSVQEVLAKIPHGQIVKTLFSGSASSMSRNVTFASICFPLVPVIEEVIRSESSPIKSLSHSTQSAIAGAVSGAVATLASNPFTVLGTRAKVGMTSQGMINQVVELISKEGPAALWKGTTLAIPRMVIVSALTASIGHAVETPHLPSIAEDAVVIDEFPEILDLPFGS